MFSQLQQVSTQYYYIYLIYYLFIIINYCIMFIYIQYLHLLLSTEKGRKYIAGHFL